MGLFGRKKAIKNETTVQVEDVMLRAMLSGEPIDKDMALSIPAVASAVDKIANTVACIPIKFYKYEYKDKKRKVTEQDDNRTKLLNDDTGDTLDGFQFKKALVIDYLLGKGGYAYIKRKGNDVKSLHYVDETKITISTGNDAIFKKYKLTVDGKDYRDFDFIKILRNTKDGASGESVINEVNKALATAYHSLLLQLRLLKRGGNKKGVLESEKKLTAPALAELSKAWNELYHQDENIDRTPVLNDGVKFRETSATSAELQLNESRRQLNEDINSIFHISTDKKQTFEDAILPILTAIETALNRDLLLEVEKGHFFFAFDTKESTKEDLKTRFETYAIAIKNRIMNPNECRYIENYDPIEGLDVFYGSQGDIIFDPKTQTYFLPNTNTVTQTDGTQEAKPTETTEGENEV